MRPAPPFVALADTLVDDYDIIDLLDRLVGYSVELLAADAAGIMLGDAHRELRVVAATSDDARVARSQPASTPEPPRQIRRAGAGRGRRSTRSLRIPQIGLTDSAIPLASTSR